MCDQVMELLFEKLGMNIPEFKLDRKIMINFDKKNNLFYLNGIDNSGAYYSLF